MKNITEVARELIEEKKDFVSLEEIIKNLDNTIYTEKELKALIYTDLITDGEFFLKDSMWNLKINYTLDEINKIRSQQIIDDILYDDEDAAGDDSKNDVDELYSDVENININSILIDEEQNLDGEN